MKPHYGHWWSDEFIEGVFFLYFIFAFCIWAMVVWYMCFEVLNPLWLLSSWEACLVIAFRMLASIQRYECLSIPIFICVCPLSLWLWVGGRVNWTSVDANLCLIFSDCVYCKLSVSWYFLSLTSCFIRASSNKMATPGDSAFYENKWWFKTYLYIGLLLTV